MCGICGFSGLSDFRRLKEMTGALIHRGPDGEGFYQSGRDISLGMRRLAVIDLDTGSQPIYNEDKSVAVVYNGEIYNFRELRSELESRGHIFRTKTDTEVIVHGYEEYGEDCPKHFRGMFAFALWDSGKKKLILARDHIGIKPLFYSEGAADFFFSSEIGPLLNCPGIDLSIDRSAIIEYFTFLYIRYPLTVYRGIRKLPPASILIRENGRSRIKKYWEPPVFSPDTALNNEKDCLDNIVFLLKQSIKEQSVSDVSLGIFLSGGLDSSALVALAAQTVRGPLRTFTAGYGASAKSYDETAKSGLIAEKFGTDHNGIILKPDITGILPRLVSRFGEPFADSSAIPTYLVSEFARRKITVALTGIGGDELFSGYPRHLGARLSLVYDRVPGFLKNSLSGLSSLLSEQMSGTNFPGRLKRFLKSGPMSFGERYLSWMTYIPQEEKKEFFADGFYAGTDPETDYSAQIKMYLAMTKLEDIYPVEIMSYLTSDLLTLADRMSMANSLELRVPFLDLRLIEFAGKIPVSLKTRGYNLKYLLKKAMRGILPEEILSQGKKGFQIPIAGWINNELREMVRDSLSPSRIKRSGFFNPGYVSRMLDLHFRGRRNYSDQIYALLVFDIWYDRRNSLDQAAVPLPASLSRSGKNIAVFTDIIPADEEGGSGTVVWELCRVLKSRGYEISVFTKGKKSKISGEMLDGITVYRYFSNPLKLSAMIAGAFQTRMPGIIFLHHPYTAFWGMKYLKNIPAFYFFQSPWHEEYEIRAADLKIGKLRKTAGSFVRKLVERYVLKKAEKIFTASGFMSARLKKIHSMASVTVPLGVDTARFCPAASFISVRKDIGLPLDKTILLTVRNLVSRMGLENLILAVKEIIKTNHNIFLVIGGEGYLRANLEGQVRENKLDGFIRFEGYIPDEKLPEYYQAADIFILPTRFLEGFGLVTLEAMSCGTPVLATPVGANTEVLGKFNPDHLLMSELPVDIASGVKKFLPVYRNRKNEIRNLCRKYIVENYSWEKYADRIEDRVSGYFEKG